MRAEILISGVKETRDALRKLASKELLAELRGSLKAGAEIVAADARVRVPRRTGRTAQTVRATATSGTAYVIGGKKVVPYFGWLDFGSRVPVSGRPRSVGPWKKSGTGPTRGRFIYQAVDATYDEVVETVEFGVGEVIRKAGLEP